MAVTNISQIDALKQLSAEESKAQQPDIEYQPDRAKWEARTARRLAADPSLPTKALPDGFPKELKSPLVWEGSDWTDETQWIYRLTTSDLSEIADAVKHFKNLDKPLGFVSKSTFPLHTLGSVLSETAREIHNGRGFAVIRGVPVDHYSKEDVMIIYAGVSSYIGNLRGIFSSNGTTVGHVADLTVTQGMGPIGTPAYTADTQVYHTDDGDIVSLLTFQTGAEGGSSKLSSFWRVYNHLAESRPDLIGTLSQPWPYDGFGGNPPYAVRPILAHIDGKMIVQFARRFFTGYRDEPRSKSIPPISEAQAEVLDTLQFLAEKYALRFQSQKGDLQYINNLGLVHAREGYKNDKDHIRHMATLWLRNEELCWKIPEYLNPKWQQVYYSMTPEQHQLPAQTVIGKAGQGVKS